MQGKTATHSAHVLFMRRHCSSHTNLKVKSIAKISKICNCRLDSLDFHSCQGCSSLAWGTGSFPFAMGREWILGRVTSAQAFLYRDTFLYAILTFRDNHSEQGWHSMIRELHMVLKMYNVLKLETGNKKTTIWGRTCCKNWQGVVEEAVPHN
jgi:hypothetical protein